MDTTPPVLLVNVSLKPAFATTVAVGAAVASAYYIGRVVQKAKDAKTLKK